MGAGVSLLCSALFEAIAVSWFYGLERFCRDIKEMIHFKPHIYWRICWKICSPLFILSIVVFGIFFSEPPKYQDYVYPTWAVNLGWAFASSAICMVPVMAVFIFIKEPGPMWQRLAVAISPSSEHAIIRETGIVTRFDRRHWFQL
ncbi:unnamed protein product [Darwinula stevensoni]|uniref:Uncharacterized protein n=1 Tax=Darwinula stevensoni TaxID=69355 RepID=A0A7R9A448_9CRUS|nr:unnamed protein product [Darwinula stevensoni]CAG0889256.1 unnamed protein product [Darwinula stevensoni]